MLIVINYIWKVIIIMRDMDGNLGKQWS